MTSLTELKVLIREHNITVKGKKYNELITEYNTKSITPVAVKESLRDLKRKAKTLGITLTYKDDLTNTRRDKSKTRLISDINSTSEN